MINRILFFILTRIYKVDPRMCNPINWRVAHPNEIISRMLGYEPLIFNTWQSKVQYGFENFVFFASGQIYLAPLRLEEKYHHEVLGLSPQQIEEKNKKESSITQYTLFKHYMENEPNILVKKFPAKILRLILKRHIKIQKQTLKNEQNEKNIYYDMSVSDAIKDDLSHPSIYNPLMFMDQPIRISKNRDTKG